MSIQNLVANIASDVAQIAPSIRDNLANNVLSDKPLLLSQNGAVLSGAQGQFYNPVNLEIMGVETMESSRFKQSFSVPKNGGSIEIVISANNFLNNLVLHVKLPALTRTYTGPTPNAIQQVFMSSGWGYAMFSEINYQFGVTSSSSTRATYRENIAKLLIESETAEKSQFLGHTAGGEAFSGASGEDGLQPEAVVVLNTLPFVSVLNEAKKKGFYAQSLDDTIRITLNVRQPSEYLMGSDLATYFDSSPPSVTAYLLESQYTRTTLNLRSFMVSQPQTLMHYPFYLYSPLSTIANQQYTAGILNNVVLNSWLNADIVGIAVQFVKSKYDTLPDDPAKPTALQNRNAFRSESVDELTLTWNNIIVYSSNTGIIAQVYESFNSYGNGGHPSMTYVEPPENPTTTTIGTPTNVEQVVYQIPFTHMGLNFKNKLVNAIRAGSSSPFQMSFKTNSTDLYNVYVTAIYTADLAVNQGKSFIQVS